MIYAKTFFDLQLDFATAVAADTGLPLARAVLEYTNVYIRFGLGRAFDAAHPAWCEYTAGLAGARDRGDWTYRFYLARGPDPAPPDVVTTFGCFAYGTAGPGRIRLHFANAEAAGCSPLAVERQGQRTAELAALFGHVKRTALESPVVVGASWLYNLEGYRRLFPTSYLATARVLPGRFRHMPLWGQFVDRRGEVKDRPAREFRERVSSRSGAPGLDECFPLQVLALEARACEFHDFLGI